MKKLFLFILLLVCVSGFSQTTIPGYTSLPSQYNWLNPAIFQKGPRIQAGGSPVLPGTNTGSGWLYYDTTGTDTGLYVYHHPYFTKVSSVTSAAQGLSLNGNIVELGATSNGAQISGTRRINGKFAGTVGGTTFFFDSLNFVTRQSGVETFASRALYTLISAKVLNAAYTQYSDGLAYTLARDSIVLGGGGTPFASPTYIRMLGYDSSIRISSKWADQYATDSLIWRTDSRNTHLSIYEDSMVYYQGQGEHYVYRLDRETDTTGLDLMAWNRSTWKWVRIPNDIVGGGGSQGLQDVITTDNNLLGNNSIRLNAGTLSIDSADAFSVTLSGDTYADVQLFKVSQDGTGFLGDGTNSVNGTYFAVDDENENHIAGNLKAGLGTKAVRYDPGTGFLTYADTTTGGASGLTVGTTTITSGTNTRVLYNNSGVLGEYTVTGTGTTAVLSTSPTFTTSIISPLVIGGTGTGSSLTLQSTSGVGATDLIDFKVGNNGATQALRINNAGESIFGTSTTDNGTYTLQVNGPAIYTGSTIKLSTGSNTRIDYSTNSVGILGNTQTYLGVSSGTVLVDIRSTGIYMGGSAAAVSTIDIAASMGWATTSTSTDITTGTTQVIVRVDASGAARTITLPAAASSTRRVYVIKKSDSSVNTVTIDGNASETIDGATTRVISTQYAGVVISCNGTGWDVIGTF